MSIASAFTGFKEKQSGRTEDCLGWAIGLLMSPNLLSCKTMQGEFAEWTI
jgi:hypothetical protein